MTGAGVLCCDQRLQLVWTARTHPGRPRKRREPVGDARPVPLRAILIGEEYKLAARILARVAARVLEQQQRQQPQRLCLCGQQRYHEACQADRL